LGTGTVKLRSCVKGKNVKMVGQPKDYSDILKRVFCGSLVSGIACTFLLAQASPSVKKLLNSVSSEGDIGFVKNIGVLYVLIPGVVVVISRIIKLHDRISDLFRIRHRFDTKYILFRIAIGVGVTLTENVQKSIKKNRVQSMYTVFYPYAGFKNPLIDDQLVRTGADHWGWFWLLVESSFLFLVTGMILVFVGEWSDVGFCLIIVFVEMGLMVFLWLSCRRCAKREVEEILKNRKWKNEIGRHFEEISRLGSK